VPNKATSQDSLRIEGRAVNTQYRKDLDQWVGNLAADSLVTSS